MNLSWLWEWLKQPSTLRAINALAGLAGVAIAPELWAQIVGIAVAVWAVIDGVYNRQPAKPE